MSQLVGPPLHIAGEWDIYPAGGITGRIRWLLKQAASFLYLYCGWTALRDAVLSLRGRSRIVILYYHRVGWIDALSKPTGAFRAELEYLARHYECLTMQQLCERLRSRAPIHRKIAVVTFDDGYRDNFVSAFPELKRAGVPATIFVATGYIGTQRRFPHDSRALAQGRAVRDDWAKLSWDELRQMQDAGIEIGSHTVEHSNMGSGDVQLIAREVRDSLAILQQELGARPRCFCFPWGGPRDITPEALREIRQAEYYAAVTTSPGNVARGDDLFRLRRIDVGNGHFTHIRVRAAMEGFGCGRLARHLRRQ